MKKFGSIELGIPADMTYKGKTIKSLTDKTGALKSRDKKKAVKLIPDTSGDNRVEIKDAGTVKDGELEFGTAEVEVPAFLVKDNKRVLSLTPKTKGITSRKGEKSIRLRGTKENKVSILSKGQEVAVVERILKKLEEAPIPKKDISALKAKFQMAFKRHGFKKAVEQMRDVAQKYAEKELIKKCEKEYLNVEPTKENEEEVKKDMKIFAKFGYTPLSVSNPEMTSFDATIYTTKLNTKFKWIMSRLDKEKREKLLNDIFDIFSSNVNLADISLKNYGNISEDEKVRLYMEDLKKQWKEYRLYLYKNGVKRIKERKGELKDCKTIQKKGTEEIYFQKLKADSFWKWFSDGRRIKINNIDKEVNSAMIDYSGVRRDAKMDAELEKQLINKMLEGEPTKKKEPEAEKKKEKPAEYSDKWEWLENQDKWRDILSNLGIIGIPWSAKKNEIIEKVKRQYPALPLPWNQEGRDRESAYKKLLEKFKNLEKIPKTDEFKKYYQTRADEFKEIQKKFRAMKFSNASTMSEIKNAEKIADEIAETFKKNFEKKVEAPAPEPVRREPSPEPVRQPSPKKADETEKKNELLKKVITKNVKLNDIKKTEAFKRYYKTRPDELKSIKLKISRISNYSRESSMEDLMRADQKIDELNEYLKNILEKKVEAPAPEPVRRQPSPEPVRQPSPKKAVKFSYDRAFFNNIDQIMDGKTRGVDIKLYNELVRLQEGGDFYQTPASCLFPVLNDIKESGLLERFSESFFEPAFGFGKFTRMLIDNLPPNTSIETIDGLEYLRDTYDMIKDKIEISDLYKGDFMEFKPTKNYDLIFMNPPFEGVIEDANGDRKREKQFWAFMVAKALMLPQDSERISYFLLPVGIPEQIRKDRTRTGKGGILIDIYHLFSSVGEATRKRIAKALKVDDFEEIEEKIAQLSYISSCDSFMKFGRGGKMSKLGLDTAIYKVISYR